MKNAPKNALVTGAGKRVGQAVAIALAKDGWNIALHHNSTDVAETIADVEKAGVKFCTIRADLNNHAETATVLPAANAALGEISLLINNASIFEKCSFVDTDEDIFDRHMNINFKAPFFLSQAFAKQTDSGQIINICDTNITRNSSTYFAYLLSKKSLSDLTRMLAVELGPKILVNEIALGACDLPQSYDKEHLKKRLLQTPLQSATTLEDITRTISYFCSQKKLTGQTIFLDAGESLI